jgi:hypothetical protein
VEAFGFLNVDEFTEGETALFFCDFELVWDDPEREGRNGFVFDPLMAACRDQRGGRSKSPGAMIIATVQLINRNEWASTVVHACLQTACN